VAAGEDGEVREFGLILPLLQQAHALILIPEIFTMFEWQVEEGSCQRRDLLVETAGNGVPGGCKREAIGCERSRGIAKHVPGKLIEQDHEGQALTRAPAPAFQLAGNCLLVDRNEPPKQLRIEGRCLGEPPLPERLSHTTGVGAEPETQELAGARISSCRRPLRTRADC
jgi:hypothetical protein